MPASTKKKRTPIQNAIRVFERHGGMLRTGEALQAGIHPRTLYEMRDSGTVEVLSRGLYRLTSAPPLSNPDLVAVTLRIHDAVICLISALAYHELTTQIPHEVHLALPRGTEPPRIDYPPVRSFYFSGAAYTEGIETHSIDGVDVRIYSPEKTLADCFKYRNKIGQDTVLEAIRHYKEKRRIDVEALLRFATIDRVARVMRPYVEAIL